MAEESGGAAQASAVEDRSEGVDHDAEARPDGPEPDDLDAPEGGEVVPAPAPVEGAPRRLSRLRRRDVLIALAVLVVLVGAGVVVARLVAEESPDETAGLLDGVAPTDTFDRQTDLQDVGVAANGDSWNAVSGVWGIDAAQVHLAQGALGGARNLLTLDMGASDGVVAATFARSRPGAGLVFRYAGPDDFWVVLPAPEFGTWVVQHLVDEQIVVNENIGLADTEDGIHVVLEITRTRVAVAVADHPAVAVQIDPSEASMVGFTSLGYGSNAARWDDFYAIPA
jgi:hypothetical protein